MVIKPIDAQDVPKRTVGIDLEGPMSNRDGFFQPLSAPCRLLNAVGIIPERHIVPQMLETATPHVFPMHMMSIAVLRSHPSCVLLLRNLKPLAEAIQSPCIHPGSILLRNCRYCSVARAPRCRYEYQYQLYWLLFRLRGR